jgi:hypothetical protein
MPSTNNVLWGLACALMLVIGLIVGRTGLIGQTVKAPPESTFREDFPFKQIRQTTFKDQTVTLDGNEYVDCTFINVMFKFDGQAPFKLTNDHFENRSKFGITSDNPAVNSTIRLMTALVELETHQNQPNQQNGTQDNH